MCVQAGVCDGLFMARVSSLWGKFTCCTKDGIGASMTEAFGAVSKDAIKHCSYWNGQRKCDFGLSNCERQTTNKTWQNVCFELRNYETIETDNVIQ